LTLILKNKIKRSQPSAAPTGGIVVCFSGGVAGDFADALVVRFELAVRHFRSRYDLCRSCRRLRSFDVDLEKQGQQIAAFGSSYRGICGVLSGGVAGDFADALVQRFELAVRHFR
jgi:hypothetical protein